MCGIDRENSQSTDIIYILLLVYVAQMPVVLPYCSRIAAMFLADLSHIISYQ